MSGRSWHSIRNALRGKTARTYSPIASFLLLAPLMATLVGFFFYPIGTLLLTSIWDPDFTLAHYRRLISERLYITILLRTFRVSLLVCFLTLVSGYPVAYVLSRLRGWRAGFVAACVIMPLWTSVLVRSYAWTVLLQRNGVVNSWLLGLGLIEKPLQMLYTEGAVLLAMTHVLLPFMILPIYSTLRSLPRDLILAAQNLGASPFATFRHVILPLSMPGVAAGSLFVSILSLGFFITPALVGGPRALMISTLISQQATVLLNWPFAAALAGLLLTVTVSLVLTFNRTLRLHRVMSDAT